MPIGYMPQLDGLRALAVIAVMYTHYLTETAWLFGIYWGGLGVELFFVLSGFLITQILWVARARIEEGIETPRRELGRFLMRRFLRLAPALGFVLAAAALLDLGPVRATLAWHLAYLSNFYFLLRGDWDGCISHLWSLAAEEQFYLLWSVFALFVPRRHLLVPIWLAIATGPLFRAVAVYLAWPQMASWVMVPAYFDLLGAGALLACLVQTGAFASRRTRFAWTAICACAGVVWGACHAIDGSALQSVGWSIFEPTLWAAVVVWLVRGAAEGFRGWTGRVLGSRPLVALGRISYGVYLIHNFPLTLLEQLDDRGFKSATWVRPILAVVSTLALAVLSWRFIERPFHRLRRRFE